jgi:trehalose 6-phosphate synthase/phosphatase
MAQVLIVSNRLPVTVKKVDGALTYETSMGGLSSGLSGYVTGRSNVWIGWPGIASDDLTDIEKRAITKHLARQHCTPIFLTQKQIDEFYSGYCNGLLWPILHGLKPGPDKHHERWWRAYRDINKMYATAIIAAANHDATIWVHDYQLMLVPEHIKRDLPHNHIGFFLHTTFPPFKGLQKLPEAKRLVGSLLQADLVGLQTPVNVEHFTESVEGFELGTVANGLLIMRGRSVQITDFPIGIDFEKFDKAYQLPDVKRAVRRMRSKYGSLKIIAGVDRLDITKGFVERLQAYQEFLRRHPKQQKKVVFVLVGAPSRSDVPAYQKLARSVDKMVNEINTQFGTKSWQPVDYIKGMPFHEVTALFQIADVGFVTPRIDGMNLVAKEFIASNRKKGVLILSQHAGAAEELTDALLVNLDQPETLVAALEQALAMRKIDITGRFDAMNEIVANHTIHGWAKDFMGALKKPIPLPVRPLTAAVSRKLILEYHRSNRRAFFLDYDGTLAELVPRPEDAKPTPEVLLTLKKLASSAKNDVFVISGRSRHDLGAWLGDTGVGLVAEHGAFIRLPGKQQWQHTATTDTSWKKPVLSVLNFYAHETPGAHVEEKSTALVWHYRESPAFQSTKNMVLLKKELKPLLQQFGLRAHDGKKVVEIKHKDTHKGAAIKQFLTEQRYDFILTAGDDYTDENMFKAVPDWAYSLKVGSGGTDARFRIKSVAAMVGMLNKLFG